MLIAGHYVVVFNYDTILSTKETLDQAIRAAMLHSSQVHGGTYEIYKLDKPVKKGTLGETIKWEE